MPFVSCTFCFWARDEVRGLAPEFRVAEEVRRVCGMRGVNPRHRSVRHFRRANVALESPPEAILNLVPVLVSSANLWNSRVVVFRGLTSEHALFH